MDGEHFRAAYNADFSGESSVPGCLSDAAYCSADDGILAREVFRVQVDGRDAPIVVSHWGNFAGGFEFWSADWYAPEADMSLQLILSGGAPDTPAMTFDANLNSATAKNMAQLATELSVGAPSSAQVRMAAFVY